VVDENMVVLGGNMRLLALQKMGASDCQIRMVSGLTPEQKREFVIKDNSNFGRYDFDSLANEWSDLPLADWGVDLPDDWTGADKGEPADAEPQIDKAAELNKVWKVKSGDLWQIGEHRLLCGDSTKKEDVGRVMGEEKADMVFTDPPYGMFLSTAMSERQTVKGNWKSHPKKYEKVIGDNDDFKPELINTIFDNFNGCKEIFIFGADYFAELIPKRNEGSWVVWDKRAGVETMEWSTSEFELIWSKQRHHRKIARITWSGILGTEQEPDHSKGRQHPTQKPTKLAAWFLEQWSKENETVIDLYAGAGFTMVACQNLNRKCYGIEISENYCAVILQRMKDAFPGIEIRRENA